MHAQFDQRDSRTLLLQGLTRSCIQYVQTHPSKRPPTYFISNGSLVCDKAHSMLCANPNHIRLCISHTCRHACRTDNSCKIPHLPFLVRASSFHKHQICGACIAGSVHDTVCMRLFAAGLLATGLKDEAAGVYYSLLQEGADRAQQVACSNCSSRI